MKTLATAVFLGFLGLHIVSACVADPRRDSYARGRVERQRWPLGQYELVSFNGQRLPVELPDGTTIETGSVTLSERRAGSAGGKGVSFRMRFQFPDTLSRKLWRYGGRSGYVWLEEEPSAGSRTPLVFEVQLWTAEVGSNAGFDDFPLEWWDPKEAPATLFGNELRVGEREKYLVFMRR